MNTEQLRTSFYLPELQRPEFIRRLWIARDHGPAFKAVRFINTL
jgi:hypothetical protein